MLQDLMEIRNKIEHDDERPPRLKGCSEWLDMVWYFLRTTDDVVRTRTEDLSFEESFKGPHWVHVDMQIERR